MTLFSKLWGAGARHQSRLTPGLTPGLAGRNRVGGTMGANATYWRAAHVNWFTRRGWRKRYRHRHARQCAPILSVGSGAHSRDHAVDRTGGSDLGAVPHRRPLLREDEPAKLLLGGAGANGGLRRVSLLRIV